MSEAGMASLGARIALHSETVAVSLWTLIPGPDNNALAAGRAQSNPKINPPNTDLGSPLRVSMVIVHSGDMHQIVHYLNRPIARVNSLS